MGPGVVVVVGVSRMSPESSGALASAGAVGRVEQMRASIGSGAVKTVPCCAEPRPVMPERVTCAGPAAAAVAVAATVVAADDVALEEAPTADGVAVVGDAGSGSSRYGGRISCVSGAVRSRSLAW